MSRKVLVAGATGLVGSEILAKLAGDDIADARALVRRPLDGAVLAPNVRQLVANFAALDAKPDWFRVDQVFCALGTTMRRAGSKEAFRRVDFDYPLAIARLARAQGARHFLLVSAASADASSRIFYSRVKGEIEDALRGLGFPALTIARPSILLGPRKERRAGELVMKRIGFLLPAAFRPVEARQVASALVRAARVDTSGVTILDNIALRCET